MSDSDSESFHSANEILSDYEQEATVLAASSREPVSADAVENCSKKFADGGAGAEKTVVVSSKLSNACTRGKKKVEEESALSRQRNSTAGNASKVNEVSRSSENFITKEEERQIFNDTGKPIGAKAEEHGYVGSHVVLNCRNESFGKLNKTRKQKSDFNTTKANSGDDQREQKDSRLHGLEQLRNEHGETDGWEDWGNEDFFAEDDNPSGVTESQALTVTEEVFYLTIFQEKRIYILHNRLLY